MTLAEVVAKAAQSPVKRIPYEYIDRHVIGRNLTSFQRNDIRPAEDAAWFLTDYREDWKRLPITILHMPSAARTDCYYGANWAQIEPGGWIEVEA